MNIIKILPGCLANLGSSDEDKTFLEHIDELRRIVIKSIAMILISSVIAYYLKDKIVEILIRPLGKELVFLSPTEAFTTFLKLSLIAGIVISLPYIIYQILQFISVIFDRDIKNKIMLYVLFSLILFYGAMVFCYFAILPVALNFLINYPNIPIVPTITFSSYLDFAIFLLMSFGIAFQFPLIILFLINLGIVSIRELSRKRAFVILFIFIFAALITPSGDAVTMFLLAIPMIILFEITMLLARFKKTGEKNLIRT